jgi:CHAT domain
MSERDELLAAIAGRVNQVSVTGDLSPVLEPRAVAEAERLTMLLDDQDLSARHALGWLYWYRYQALLQGADSAALASAVGMLSPCLVSGTGPLPETLLPLLADEVAAQAAETLVEALGSGDLERINDTIGLWRRVIQATPDGDPDRPGRLSALGYALRARFGHTRDPADLDAAVTAMQAAADSTPDDDPGRAVLFAHLGYALREQFDEGARLTDLDAAITVLQGAVEAAPAGHPERVRLLTSLADSLWHRYQRFDAAADLDAAISAMQRAAQAAPEGDNRAQILDSLGQAMHARFGRNGTGADLDAAIAAFQEAAEGTPVGYHFRAMILAHLGAALKDRFARAGEPADLDTAIDVLRAAADETPQGHPDRPDHLANLAKTIAHRFRRTRSPGDLDTVVELFEMAADGASDDHPSRAAIVSDLAAARRIRAGRIRLDAAQQAAAARPGSPLASRVTGLMHGVTGSLAELDATIRDLQLKLDSISPGAQDRLAYLAAAGHALRTRYRRAGNPPDLDAAIRAMREWLTIASAGSPYRATQQGMLAEALQERYRHNQQLDDLNAAIAGWTAAAGNTPLEAFRMVCLSALGLSLETRFHHIGNAADLDAAVAARRSALDIATGPARASCLSGLGTVLEERYRHTENPSDLDAAVAACRAAVAAASSSDRDRGRYQSGLGVVLCSLASHTGNLAYLDEAVAHQRAVLEATSAADPDRDVCASRLSSVLLERSEWTGSQADLDAAVEVAQEAVSSTRPADPARAGALACLAHALTARFQHVGDIDDFQAAINAFQDAVAATPAGHRDHIWLTSSMAAALLASYRHIEHPPALDMAIEMLQAMIVATPGEDPQYPVQLGNLGHALQTRFGHTQDEADLDSAVDMLRAATQAAAGPYQASCLGNLASALAARYGCTENPADLDAAIQALQAAIDGTPEEHAERAAHLSSLGSALRTRFERAGAEADSAAAVTALTAAAAQQAAAPIVRIRAAASAASLLERSAPDRAANLFKAAIALMPEVPLRSLSRRNQQQRLAEIAGLAADAAAATLADTVTHPGKRGRAIRALRLLEAGRAVLISETLNTRSDLTELRVRHPGLAQRFTELRDQMDRTGNAPRTRPGTTAGTGQSLLRDVGRRRRLAATMATTLDEIRAKDGFGSFAKPPPIAELIAEATAGPIVVCNIGKNRSDAILLTATGADYLELPELSRGLLAEKIASFQSTVHRISDRSMALHERIACQQTLLDILGWLWDAVAGPVLHALGIDRAPVPGEAWPRVWWAPGGALSLLPLHAAGHHAERHDSPAPRTVMDRAVSSYTPTIRALRHSREHARIPAGPVAGQSLIVAMPTTPGIPDGAPLPHVATEARRLRGLLPAPVLLIQPRAEDAAGIPTKPAVLARLSQCAIAHFACHGITHSDDPSQSRLLLSDHESDPLTVTSLASVNLEHARLAYLSACGTASAVNGSLLDEAIHLTSACQLAGYPHVVGTLWEINDAVSAEVAAMFYAGLRTEDGSLDTSRAARALHGAVRLLREQYPSTPSMWAAYIHAGA